MREIVNAIFYVLRSGCAWRLLPDSFPPRQTVYGWFLRLRDDCVLERLNRRSGHARPRAQRARRQPFGGGARQPKRQDDGGRRAEGLRRRQEDQGQKAPRPRRHRRSSPGAGASPGRHPGPRRRRARRWRPRATPFPSSRRSSPTAATPGSRVAGATAIAVEIVRKNPDQVGFAVQPRRWVVERFFAWIGRNRRLAKDCEQLLDPPEPSLTPPPSCCSPDGSRNQDEFRVGRSQSESRGLDRHVFKITPDK